MKSKAYILLLCLAVSGCTRGPAAFKQLVSPAQAAYDHAEAHFQQKDFTAAVSAYENFIKDYPRSNLVPGAYLGIAWAHYLNAKFKETIDALAQVRTQDQGLRAWMEKLKTEAQNSMVKSEKSVTPTLFNIPAFTNQDTLKVEGALPEGGKVIINGQEVSARNGIFSKELSLSVGNNVITFEITGKDSSTETKQINVVLDKTPPKIKVTSAELDNFGYVSLEGVTKPGAKVTAGNEPLRVDETGKFSGQVKWPTDRQITLTSQDRAGNIHQEVFSHNEYPDKPTGLRLRSVHGGNLADIEWNANREPDMKGYNVYYSLAGEFSDTKNNRELVIDTKYTMDNLQKGKTYSVYVRAVDKMGNESEPSSETITATIPP